MRKMFKKLALLAMTIFTLIMAGCGIEQPEWLEQAICDHVYDEQEVIAEPTCEENGKTLKVCSDCGKTKIVSVKALGHSIIEDAGYAPTCTEPGLTAGSHCATCQEIIVSQEEIPAEGHTILYQETSAGHRMYCALCDYKTVEVAHEYEWVVEETKDVHKCVCGAVELEVPTKNEKVTEVDLSQENVLIDLMMLFDEAMLEMVNEYGVVNIQYEGKEFIDLYTGDLTEMGMTYLYEDEDYNLYIKGEIFAGKSGEQTMVFVYCTNDEVMHYVDIKFNVIPGAPENEEPEEETESAIGTWIIDSGWGADDGYGRFDVEGTLNGHTFTEFAIGWKLSPESNLYDDIDANTVSWQYNLDVRGYIESTTALTLTITGGDGANNPDLITWLKQYGKKEEQEETVQVSGTLYFNASFPTKDFEETVSFVSDGVAYKTMSYSSDGDGHLYYDSTAVWSHSRNDANQETCWYKEEYRTITFDGVQNVSAEFYELLTANTTRPISGTWKFVCPDNFEDLGYWVTETNFISNGQSFSGIDGFSKSGCIYYGDTLVWQNGVWVDEKYQFIQFEGTRYITANDYGLIAEHFAFAFTIDGTTYYAEEGMTWGEWVASEYNTNGYKDPASSWVHGNYCASLEGELHAYVASEDGENVHVSDIILNQNYIIVEKERVVDIA